LAESRWIVCLLRELRTDLPRLRSKRRRVFKQFFLYKLKNKRQRKPKSTTVGKQIELMTTKVLNPKTNRWVLKTSKLGKHILSMSGQK
jgi:hypothetical protein